MSKRVARSAAKPAVKSKGQVQSKLRIMDLTGQIHAINNVMAVIEFDLDGTIKTANENFLKTMGYTLQEIQGKHHSIFAEAAYAQSGDYREFWVKLNHGEFQSAEYKRLSKGGRTVWIQASYNPIMDLNGKPFKVVKYATDVTQEKIKTRRAQSMLSMIENAATNFMTCDQTFEITYCNAALIEMFKHHQQDIGRVISGFSADKLVGNSIELFKDNTELHASSRSTCTVFLTTLS